MNHPSPVARPALSLNRPATRGPAASGRESLAQLTERDNLAAELARLREAEANLRAYEARLRAWQDRLDRSEAGESVTQPSFPATASRSPIGFDPELLTAWTKFHRAHELLQNEQSHLRDERISVSAREAELKRREEAVRRRESYIAKREAQAREERERVVLAALLPPKKPSVFNRITRSPFVVVRAAFASAK